MKKFITLYFIFIAILFSVFYVNTNMFSTYINNNQTNLTLYILNIFLDPSQLKGIDIWINPHYKIIISKACNGIIPILFLFSSILAYPSRVGHKIFWMFVGYAVFSLVNVIRILMVVYFVEQQEGKSNFYWSHDIVGNILLLFFGLGLFITFIKTSSYKKESNIGL